MDVQLPKNSAHSEHRAPQGRTDDPTAVSHLDHLLPSTSANKNLVVSLIESVKELINPPKLPPLEVTSKPIDFVDTKGMYAGNESKAFGLSLLTVGTLLGLAILVGTNKTVQNAIKETVTPIVAPVLARKVPLPPKEAKSGGGGGGGEKLPDSKGKLPKIAPKQFIPPTVHTVDDPKLAVTPTIVASADLPNINAPNYGDPLAGIGIPSNGTGKGNGIGPGRGSGIGPGEGGGYGGGVFAIGNGVSRPEVVSKVEPEYSEEARKAKYQGEVWLSVVVDEKGIPQDVKVTRKLGLGLDEKAIEAVMKWRFRPGLKDGKPVAVRATIAVSFHLL
jgi:TonB family protein